MSKYTDVQANGFHLLIEKYHPLLHFFFNFFFWEFVLCFRVFSRSDILQRRSLSTSETRYQIPLWHDWRANCQVSIDTIVIHNILFTINGFFSGCVLNFIINIIGIYLNLQSNRKQKSGIPSWSMGYGTFWLANPYNCQTRRC